MVSPPIYNFISPNLPVAGVVLNARNSMADTARTDLPVTLSSSEYPAYPQNSVVDVVEAEETRMLLLEPATLVKLEMLLTSIIVILAVLAILIVVLTIM